jgi:SDR family mycofactocin-dependent oxidoreductase
MGSLDGRVALVTGAGRGQGRAHALALAAEGAAVVAGDLPGKMTSLSYPLATQEDLDTTVAAVESLGGRCLGVAVDVRDPAAVHRAVDRARAEFGRLDILVANAGVVSTGPLHEVTDEAWSEMVDTNLTGVFHCLRAVVPGMRADGYGRIVVTSSMGGRMGIPNLGAYNATKWGLIGMAKSLALEVVGDGITVNVVCPATVGTPMVLQDSMFRLFAPDVVDPGPADVVDRFARVNPIRLPWLDPEDVTREVLHLITDRGVLTGTVMEIGLGSSARMH